MVTSDDFRLSGVIIDKSPVAVTFYNRENLDIPVSRRWATHLTEFNLRYQLPAGLSTFRLVATHSDRRRNALRTSPSVKLVTRVAWYYLSSRTHACGAGALVLAEPQGHHLSYAPTDGVLCGKWQATKWPGVISVSAGSVSFSRQSAGSPFSR